jgi:PIN domain nuclease of toxin-antitoxin system
MIYLDTHVVVWLYVGDLSKFSNPAKTALNTHPIVISPIVILEVTYLHEIGRLKTQPSAMIDYLSNRIGLKISDVPFEQVIASALQQTWTRDPFDRIIVGHAAIHEHGLVTKDDEIRDNYIHAVW